MRRVVGVSFSLLGTLVVLIVFFWMGRELFLFEGFPKGVDPYAHLFKIKYILTYFPQLSYNPLWNSGTPFWLWTYPPFSFFPSAILSAFSGFTPEMALTAVTAISMGLFFVGLFITAWILSRNVWIGVGLAVLAALTPATWSWWGHGGNYIRLFGMGWWTLSLAFFFLHFRKRKKPFYGLYLLFASLAFGTHFYFVNLIGILLFWVIIFAVRGWKEKIAAGFKYLGVPLLITSYWLVPMMLTSGGQSRFIQKCFAKPLLFEDFIKLDPQFPYFTFTFIFTAIFLLGVLIGLSRLFSKKLTRIDKGIFSALALVSLVQLGYSVIGHLPGWPEQAYFAVVTPSVSLPILMVHGVLLVGASLTQTKENILAKAIKPLFALGLGLACFFYIRSFLPFPPIGLYDVSQPHQRQSIAQEIISKAQLSPAYRFGTDSAFIADWFNYLYPHIPQTRHYIYQGTPYKTWQYFQERTIWAEEGRDNETEWLLDWYAIDYFSVGMASVDTQFDKFLNRPDLFEKIDDSADEFYLFRYKKAKPILSVSKTPTLLIIGSETAYETMIRLLALTGLGSERIIPVWGGENLAKIRPGELEKFDMVYLYDYKADSRSYQSLSDYIKGGGKLYIEAETIVKRNGELVEFFPFNELKQSSRDKTWNLTGEILEREEGAKFSAADFEGAPWKVAIPEGIKGWARPIMFSENEPIMLVGDYGQGKIIWSGINFPYHALSYRNETEVRVFRKSLSILVDIEQGYPLQEASWAKWTPQERTLSLNGGEKGILIKESWFPNWKAYLQKSLKIYPAGPNLMYIPLLGETSPSSLQLNYTHRLEEILGWLISLVTIIGVGFYLIIGRIPFLSSRKIGLINKFSSWWDVDE